MSDRSRSLAPLTSRRLWDWRETRAESVQLLTVAAIVLYAATVAILHTESIKYLAGFVAAGVLVNLFLFVRNKHSLLLFASGFSIPFFVQVILMERDRAGLTITGYFLIVFVLGALLVTTRIGLEHSWRLEARIVLPALIYLGASAFSFWNTTDWTLTTLVLLRQIEMILVFVILVNAVWNENNLFSLVRGLYAGFGIECFIYVVQNILGVSFDILGNTKMVGATDVDRGYIGSQRGTFDSAPSVAALYFSLLTLSLIGLYLCRRASAGRLKPAVGIIMGLGCLALAAKRAPLAGFVLGLGVLCFLLARHSPGGLRRLAPVLGFLLIPTLIFAPVLILRAEANHEAAFEERKNLTRVAWEMFHAHPILGVGMGTYATVLRAYLPADWSGWVYTVHNNYLMVLAEGGIVALAALLFLYCMMLRMTWQGIRRIAVPYRPLQISLVAGLVSIYWEMIWDMFNGKQQEYILWLLVAIATILPRIFSAVPRASPS